tara:strand:- start:4071 stop:5057 length:987 start_codon:yes stop_codon:yes gene_type:complete
MASTYTANSGIEKPGSGEQSGTWGATTNTNFDIIDRALSGVGSITLSGTTHTLSSTDGALADGHYKVLVLGGSPSGANTITISPNDQDKAYLVHNNTSQSAIFTQGSGGNATVAAGAFAWIFADGAGSGAVVTKMTVDTASIENSAITTAKIADNAVTAAKLADTAVFASGTKMLFQQTAAPTGWTKDTTHNDKALRVVSGTVTTGGSNAFSSAFSNITPAGSVSTSISGSVASHTLSIAQIPAHNHSGVVQQREDFNPTTGTTTQTPLGFGDTRGGGRASASPLTINNTGGGQGHNHGFSGSATSTFTGTAINLDVQYVDIIIAQKN